MADNMADKVAKGRQARGDRSGSRAKPESRPRGDDHHNAELTSAAVDEIRRLYVGRRKGGPTLDELARRFAVSRSTICDALKGRTWQRLGDTAPAKKDNRVTLSDADVEQIRSLYRGRGKGPTGAELGRRFGVTQAMISLIVLGKFRRTAQHNELSNPDHTAD